MVLILPMRNGNIIRISGCSISIIVLILPMRNGNNIFVQKRGELFPVLILPMRNGNYASFINSFVSFLCSYPTYEEWKLCLPPPKSSTIFCSYPTYEEWKPLSNFDCIPKDYVLILPMRNGNVSLPLPV